MRFPERRVLAVWGLVTAIIATMVLNAVLPWVISRSPTAFQAYHYVVGPALLVAVGVSVERRSARPWVVAVGTVFLLWAAMSFALGCPGVGCARPDGYQYWRNIEVALDVGIGGPRLLVSAEPGACAFTCPYTLQLVPLAIGYGALAAGLSADESGTTSGGRR